MSGWGARLAVLCVFLLGFVSGAAAIHLYRLEAERRIFHSETPVAQLIVYQLDNELDLSADQERQVRDVILQIRDETLPELRADLLPKLVRVFDEGQERIRPILTEEQRAKFDALAADRRRVLEEMQRGGT
jgi:hypothetical protein